MGKWHEWRRDWNAARERESRVKHARLRFPSPLRASSDEARLAVVSLGSAACVAIEE